MLSGAGAKSRIGFVRLRRIIRLLFESEFRELVRRKTFRKRYRYAKSIKKKKIRKKKKVICHDDTSYRKRKRSRGLCADVFISVKLFLTRTS